MSSDESDCFRRDSSRPHVPVGPLDQLSTFLRRTALHGRRHRADIERSVRRAVAVCLPSDSLFVLVPLLFAAAVTSSSFVFRDLILSLAAL